MKIEPFVSEWSPVGTIIIVVGIVLALTSIVIGVVSYRRRKAQNRPDPDVGIGVGIMMAFFLGGMGWFVGAMADESSERDNKTAHYSAEASKVADAYPQLAEAGIKLKYVGGFYPEESSGNLTKVIANRGEFHPIGTSYERTEVGLDRSNVVAILNEDWTLELFQVNEAEQLVKLQPETVENG